jgi:hypothetical protein
MIMQTKKKIQVALLGLIICSIIVIGFFQDDLFSGSGTVKDSSQQKGLEKTIGSIPLNGTSITINHVPDYFIGDNFVISGSTALPARELIDIAITKEPYHFTKCEPGTFCGYKTYSTIISAGHNENTWKLDLNTSAFTEGGYDIWVISRKSPNTSVHTGLNLRKK